MGNLAAGMERLRTEIDVMCEARQAFVSRTKSAVRRMLGDFSDNRTQTGRQMKADRKETAGELRRIVAAMRGEFASDLCAARRAWFGPSAARPRVAEKLAAGRRRRPG